MKFFHFLFVFIFVLIFSGCGEDDFIIDRDNLLIGNWEVLQSTETFDNTIYQMKRTKIFSDKYGSMYFGKDSVYQVRDSWGFGAQPMVFEGTWFSINDTLIQVKMQSPFYGNEFRLAFPLLNEKEMEYYYIYDL